MSREVILNTQDFFVDKINNNRNIFYGISILLIILCHANFIEPSLSFFRLFSWGYIGVDIFFFFSAYGCCYSLHKYSYGTYLLHRIKRIYPLYFIYALLITIIYAIRGNKLTCFDVFCNMTMLSYYRVGGIQIEWYLSALMLLYVILPLVLWIVKHLQLLGYLVVLFVTIFILNNYDFDVYHKMFIGRWPSIYLGVYSFYVFILSPKQKYKFYELQLIFLSSIAAFIIAYFNGIQGCIKIDMASILLLLIISVSVPVIKSVSSIYKSISFIGRYSLELYLANILTLYVLGHIYWGNKIFSTIIYLGTVFLFGLLFAQINKMIQKRLSNIGQ